MSLFLRCDRVTATANVNDGYVRLAYCCIVMTEAGCRIVDGVVFHLKDFSHPLWKPIASGFGWWFLFIKNPLASRFRILWSPSVGGDETALHALQFEIRKISEMFFFFFLNRQMFYNLTSSIEPFFCL